MHVGVFQDHISPEVGGGYTFVDSVARAFLRTAETSQHRYTLICSPQYADAVHQSPLPENVGLHALPPRGAGRRGIAILRHLSPAFAMAWPFPSRLARVSRTLGIDLMWFVGGLHDTLDIPYITTIWDVQHLTHPWFPEVSANGRWDYREAFLARHLRRAVKIITGTKVGRDELIHFYRMAGERICILPHPTPDFALDGMKPMLGTSDSPLDRNYLLYPSQFWPHKNHVNLLRAMRILHDVRADAPMLVLAGSDKGNLAHTKRCIADLGLQEKVQILGFVPTADLVDLYRGARALVYPSFSGPENLPPLEAFALGCPVICADYAGAREQLEDAAIYFDPGRPSSIAAAIQQVLDDSALRSALNERGRARAVRWTAEDFVRGVFAIIDEFDVQRRCWS